MEHPRYTVTALTADDEAQRLNVRWGDDHLSAFPYVWLRHDVFHPVAGRPDQDGDAPCLVMEPMGTARLEKTSLVDGELRIGWAHDGTATAFDLVWLRDNCLSQVERGRRCWQPTLWGGASRQEFPWFEFDGLVDDECRLGLMLHVRDFGIALVKGLTPEAGKVHDLAAHLGPVRRTHFGELSDVRSVPDSTLR